MISLTKIMDPLSGYIAKVQKDVSDRQRDRLLANPRVSGAARILSAEDATQAAYINRLTSEINEIKSGLQNMRDGLETVEVAEAAYSDVLSVLDRMLKQVSEAQNAEDFNTALASDPTSFDAIFSSFSDEITEIIANRQVNSQSLIDGTFTNKTFPLWSGETNTTELSLNNIDDTMSSFRTFSALALDGNLQAQISGNKIVAGNTITITATGDPVTFDPLAGESASSLAKRINFLKANSNTDIGVTASVRSSLRLNDLSSAGTLQFRLYSEKQGAAYQTISSVVSDKTDLGAIAIAVNRVSETTGIFAKLGNSNQDIILRDPNGGNIAIRAFDHSVNNATITTSVDRRDGVTDFHLEGEYTNTSGNALFGNTTIGFADTDSAGSIKFDHVGDLTSDNILLATKPNRPNSAGNITIDSNKNVFFGNGSNKTLIGEVDGTHDGVGGNALQINFKQTDDGSVASRTLQFANNAFSNSGDWTAQTSQIKSGTSSLGGIAVPTDSGFLNGSARSGTLNVGLGDSEVDTMSAINVDGTNLIASTITYDTDPNTTAAAIRTAINNLTGTTNFTATGSGSQVVINKASAPSNSSIDVSSSEFSVTTTNITGTVDDDQETITNGSTPFATIVSSGKVTMTVNNATFNKGYAVAKGAAVISDDYVALAKGEKISFDWTAVGQNGDKYDIQAYLVESDGTRAGSNNMISSVSQNKTGSGSASGTVEFEVTSAGDYKLAFITGAYDADGDGDASATATLDNVVISHFSEDMVDIIKERVSFENLNFSASDTNANPQVTVTTVSESGASITDTLAVPSTLAGYALTAGSDQEVFATGEVTLLSDKSFSVGQANSSNSGTTFWDVAIPPVPNLKLLGTSSSIGTETSLTLDNASERVAFAIKNVIDYRDKYLSPFKERFDFGEFDNSNYMDSLTTTKADAIDPQEAANLTQKTAKMIISDEIQKLLLKAGNASADDVYDLIKFT
jgi:flagellin